MGKISVDGGLSSGGYKLRYELQEDGEYVRTSVFVGEEEFSVAIPVGAFEDMVREYVFKVGIV